MGWNTPDVAMRPVRRIAISAMVLLRFTSCANIIRADRIALDFTLDMSITHIVDFMATCRAALSIADIRDNQISVGGILKVAALTLVTSKCGKSKRQIPLYEKSKLSDA